MSALRFDDVTIRLGGRDILSAASFSIEDGEFVGMLGANGAGKTTLMRAALGLVPVASGEVSVLGKPPTRGNPAIGYMPQNRGAIGGLRLTGWDIVASAAMGARFGFVRLDKAARREIDWALDEVGARDLARRSIGELSGGERQRVLLSQALLGRPRLLVARRAADLARSGASEERRRDRAPHLRRPQGRDRVQRARAQSAGQRDRSRALSRRGSGGDRRGRRGCHRAGALATLRVGDRGRAHQGPLFRHGGRRRRRARGASP